MFNLFVKECTNSVNSTLETVLFLIHWMKMVVPKSVQSIGKLYFEKISHHKLLAYFHTHILRHEDTFVSSVKALIACQVSVVTVAIIHLSGV